MFEKHDGLKMSFLSGFCKIRKQALHFIDECSSSRISSQVGGGGGGVDSDLAAKCAEGNALSFTGFTVL